MPIFLNLQALKIGDARADKFCMSTSPINSLTSSYLQSIVGATLQNAGITAKTSNTSSSSVATSDNGQLSPFAQMMSTLQQLQQSNPTQYQQVTQQIASNLQSAAQTAQSEGNTTAANQLNQLSSDFSKASQSNQLPSISDLAQAIGGHHHGHHHHHVQPASADSDTSSSTDSNSSNTSTSNPSTTTSTSQSLSQLFASLQTNAAQNDALNPMNIIMSTLQSSGIIN